MADDPERLAKALADRCRIAREIGSGGDGDPAEAGLARAKIFIGTTQA